MSAHTTVESPAAPMSLDDVLTGSRLARVECQVTTADPGRAYRCSPAPRSRLCGWLPDSSSTPMGRSVPS